MFSIMKKIIKVQKKNFLCSDEMCQQMFWVRESIGKTYIERK